MVFSQDTICLSTIPRLFADYFRPPADYSGGCPATIRRLLSRSFLCLVQDRGCSPALAILGGAASGAVEKRSGNVVRRRIRRGMLRGVSVTGVLRRILNTLYLRRKRPVFAFYGLRYIRILPGRKSDVYARNGAILRGRRNSRGITPGRTQKKPPAGFTHRGEQLRNGPGKRKPRSASGAGFICCFSLRRSVSAAALTGYTRGSCGHLLAVLYRSHAGVLSLYKARLCYVVLGE